MKTSRTLLVFLFPFKYFSDTRKYIATKRRVWKAAYSQVKTIPNDVCENNSM